MQTAATPAPPRHLFHASTASDWWRDPRATTLAVVGLSLIVSGLGHLGIWAASGGPWEGPVTWRKPILFGISGGLTAVSAAWVWAALPVRWGDHRLAAITAWALFVEVLLIDLQTWRGVASHFNRSTPFDSFLYDAMGVLILIVSLVLVDLTIRLFREPTVFAADMLLAARAGMVFLVISCALGVWVSVTGDLRMAAGLEPERYGAAGVPKFPHGATIHAIQWLPLVAWVARRLGLGGTTRSAIVTAATVITAGLLIFSLAQTLTGHARFDISWW